MKWFLFYPELFYFAGGLAFLCLSMSKHSTPRRDYFTALVLAVLGVVVCLAAVNQEGFLFFNTYRVDLFSQVFKVVLSLGLFLIISICSELKSYFRAAPPRILFFAVCLHLGHDVAGQQRSHPDHLRRPGTFQLFTLHPGCLET